MGRHEAELPASQWTWLEPRSQENLHQVAHLAAEPLWITAARNGRSVFAHHPTHAPGPPSYRRLDDATPEDSLASWRAQAKAALARTDVDVLNGDNERFPPHIILASTSCKATGRSSCVITRTPREAGSETHSALVS